MIPGTEPARIRPNNRVTLCQDTYRPVAVDDRGQEIIESAAVREDIDGQLIAMSSLRVAMYPTAPEGRTRARYSLNN